MNFSKFTVSSLIGLFLTFTSCIDADYDLGKDIDMEVTIGGNLSLPIGKTDTIRLSRMIEEGDVLHVIDGKYVITKSDNISEDIDAIDEVVIDNFSPHFEPYIRTFKASSIEELPQIPGLDMPEIEVAFDANINTTEHFNVNTELPTEVKEVKTVKITDNYGKTLQTKLSIEISGMPRFLPRLYLAGVELSLPDVIDFDIDESHGDLVRNGSSIFISKTIELNQGSGSVSIPVTVYGFSDPIVENGSLILTDEISLKGKVYADKQAIGSEDLQNTTVTVQPRLDLATPQIRIKEVAGTIVPNVDINTSVSLADLPDFLKEEGTSLEVKDLALNLSVQNPIGAPISTRFQIAPLDENGNVINNIVSLALKIAGDETSTFHINRNSPVIESGSLTSLLSTIPDQIDIKVTEVKIESETADQTIVLNKRDYNLDVDYDINVPLEFDNLSIFYNDTIEDIHSDLKDVTDKVKHIELNMQVDNAIPLALNLSVKPYDQNGDPITGLELPEHIEIQAAANSDGNEQSVQSTQVKLVIKEDRKDALQELDKLAIQIGGNNQDNHDVTLRPDQFVVVHLSARLPEGAQMDLEDL